MNNGYNRVANTDINSANWSQGAQGFLSGGPLKVYTGVAPLDNAINGSQTAVVDKNGRQITMGLFEGGIHAFFNGQGQLSNNTSCALKFSNEPGDNPATSSYLTGNVFGPQNGDVVSISATPKTLDAAAENAYLSVEITGATTSGNLYVTIVSVETSQLS